MQSYLKILRQLQEVKIDFIIIGTWALKYAFRARLRDYKIVDCDLILRNDLEIIRRCIRVLRREGWTVTVWEIPIDETVTAAFLKEKYYFRAQQGDLILDLSYECDDFSWAEIEAEKLTKDGFQLISHTQNLTMKKRRGTEKDLATILLLKDLVVNR
ncbi:MAG: hypothetical protein AB8G15_04485 [Saprospiraceae bacterium]